jgi:hypothetical protein
MVDVAAADHAISCSHLPAASPEERPRPVLGDGNLWLIACIEHYDLFGIHPG